MHLCTNRWLLASCLSFLIVTLCLACLSCTPVEDLGAYWDKGVVDPDLAGSWKKMDVAMPSEDMYQSFEKVGTYYRLSMVGAEGPDAGPASQQGEMQVRSLILGKHRILMMRTSQFGSPPATQSSQPTSTTSAPASAPTTTSQPTSQPAPRWMCAIQRYAMEDGMLVVYSLREKVLAEAIAAGAITGRMPEEGDDDGLPFLAIGKLDEKTVLTLARLAEDSKNWDVRGRYTRVADLKKAIEKSREYPATQGTPENSLITVHQPDLRYFGQGKQDVLLRYLRASPAWRVTEERGKIVCMPRSDDNGLWRRTQNVYGDDPPSDRSEEERWTPPGRLLFASVPGEFPWKPHYTTEVGPLAGEIHLKLNRTSNGISSILVIGQGNLWCEISEVTQAEPRTETRQALQWLARFLADVRKAEPEIVKNGYAPSALPPDSVLRGEPSMQIVDGMQPGIYEVWAWANPGAPGRVYLKAFDVKTDARLSEERMTPRSSELIGWSGNPEELFYYNSEVTVYEGDWEHTYDARFELWFKDARTGKERKLIEVSRAINGWQR